MRKKLNVSKEVSSLKKGLAFTIAIIVCLAIVTPVIVNASNTRGRMTVGNADALPSFLSEKEVSRREEGLDIKGTLPVVRGLHTLDTVLNDKINTIYQQKVSGAKESKARYLSFKYDFKKSKDIFSLLIYTSTTTASSKAEVSSLNFNLTQEQIITVNDILGHNGLQLANKVISYKIKNDPDRFYPNFPGLQENHAFEVDGDEVIFLFDAYQIAPGSQGIIRLSMNRQHIREFTAVKNDSYWSKDDSYGLKMISIRPLCSALEYTLIWNTTSHSITIQRQGEAPITMNIGKKEYMSARTTGSDKYTKRTLEAAPMVVGGATYVPISFFDQVLDMVAYSMADDETIRFSTYLIYLDTDQ
jgi:hypothetical protein